MTDRYVNEPTPAQIERAKIDADAYWQEDDELSISERFARVRADEAAIERKKYARLVEAAGVLVRTYESPWRYDIAESLSGVVNALHALDEGKEQTE